MSDISVYGIWHRFTQMVYIGHSKSTERRFASHRNALRRGAHHCGHLQNAWTKDGESAFEFRRLVVCGTKAEALEVEQDYLSAFFEKGYLFNSAGSNDPQVFMRAAHSSSARQKNTESKRASAAFRASSMANLSKALTPDAIARRVAATHKSGKWVAATWRPVIAMRLGTGEFILFHNVTAAAKFTGTSHGNIGLCLQGRRLQAKGFRFVDAGAPA